MTDSDRYAWIQLALTPYIGADSFLRLIQHFGDAQAALRAPSDVIQQIVIKGKQAAQTWYDTTPARAATDAALQWEQQELEVSQFTMMVLLTITALSLRI